MVVEKNQIQKMLLQRRKLLGNSFFIRVSGDSMLPILSNNSVVKIIIRHDNKFNVGDIVLFFYKNEGLLIHRLLKIENGRYFCKGDNAFRLEDIEKEDIIGVALVENDWHLNLEFIQNSLMMSELFRKCKYDSILTKKQPEYEVFKNKFLSQI